MAQQTWNPAKYAENARFVANLAGGVVELLAPQPGERILDLGCGDGVLTRKLAASGARVTGVDSSPEMAAAARALGLDARLLPAERLDYDGEFDAVFSNAALHWIRDQEAVLAGVHRALKPGGRFVAEMGGHGNIAAISVALFAVWRRRGLDSAELGYNHFFTPEEYGEKLERHGFSVSRIELIPRPTALPASGMRGWLETFRRSLLDRLATDQREAVLEEAVELLRPVLCDARGNWTADYVRLRFKATR